jgi:bifunctional DNA-binding transcriptional regulator/antitoxin component of YhaV-PrlF toxin-antitoxin module
VGDRRRSPAFWYAERREFHLLGENDVPRDSAPSKLVRPLAKGQVTLPVEFRRRLCIDDETVLRVTLRSDRIEILPLKAVAASARLREYSADDVRRFLREDRLDSRTAAKVRRRLGRTRSA